MNYYLIGGIILLVFGFVLLLLSTGVQYKSLAGSTVLNVLASLSFLISIGIIVYTVSMYAQQESMDFSGLFN